MDSLLGCYFPTKIIIVDDDERTFDGFKTILDDDIAAYEYFMDPRQALKVINQSKASDCIVSSSSQENFYDIHRIMYNPHRHHEISTVIVDYEMPAMKGTEFCEKIKNPYIRKILYTGAADESIAVKAFNAGVIDGFIRKQDPHTAKSLNDLIRTNQQKYFKKLTDVLVETAFQKVKAENPKETAYFDPVFIKYFQDLVQKHKICEYYIHEPTAGFICLSPQGEKSTLFTFTKESFQFNQVSTNDIIQGLSLKDKIKYAELIEEIDKDRKIICFPFYGEYVDVNENNWTQFVHSYEIIQGTQPYYLVYASHAHLGKDSKISSFEEFQRNC